MFARVGGGFGKAAFTLGLTALTLIGIESGLNAAAKGGDKTPPTITVTSAAVDGSLPSSSGWYHSSVRLTFKCSDTGGSGLSSCPSAVTLSNEGPNQVVSGTARDKAGNTATASISVSIDLSKPLISVALSPAPGTFGYYNRPVTAHFTCGDSLSGVASCPADRTFSSDGQYTVSGAVVDRAGNSMTTTTTIAVDLTAPSMSTALSAAPNANGWFSSAVSVTTNCADAMSGVAQCPAAMNVVSAGANQQVKLLATDRAGNAASITRMFSVDTTPPVLTIASPVSGTTVTSDSIALAGSASDDVSGIAALVVGTQSAAVNSDGTFLLPSLPLTAGTNSFVVVATNRAGLSTTQTVVVTKALAQAPAPTPTPTPAPAPSTAANLIEDPVFEAGVSGFTAQDSSSSVTQSTQLPLEGAHSLRVSTAGYGNNIWWTHGFQGGRASQFDVSAHLRSDAASSSSLQFCAMVYYEDGTTAQSCAAVSGAAGDKGTVASHLVLDSTKRLQDVRMRLIQEGSAPVAFSMDTAAAALAIVEAPSTSSTPTTGSGGGTTSSGGTTASCSVTTSAYPGFTYQLPTARPFVSLSRYAQVDRASSAYIRFKAAADAALAGNPPYAYSATHSVIMYRLTGTTSYLTDAINRVEAFVSAAEATINAGGVPAIAGDSYLEVGSYLEQLSVTYDYGYGQLTAGQRQRWAAFAEQALTNVWNPDTASWGGVSHPWSGWSICDPGNNYHFSFLRATMLWTIASQNPTWLSFLQTQKFGALVAYYAQLPGGGSREGTGYGTALKSLFENYLYWRDSMGEDLSRLTSHTRETIDYWVHATVPTLDRFAPIGDQARSSIPALFDYHENLVHEAVVLSPGTAAAGRGAWWLKNNSVNGVSQSFNLYGDSLPSAEVPQAPTALVYHATGAGALFARSSWNTDAAWMAVVAGKYDQSHAHQDQGSFTFFRGDWLAVTPNIWSHSGIHQEVDVHNVLRFERADGSIVPQTPSDTLASTMTETSSVGLVTVTANLTNAYWRNQDAVQSWTRTIDFYGTTLRVTDACTVGAGVRPIFQLQVPSLPTLRADGSIAAGNLVVVPLQGVNVTWTAMPADEFSAGYRLDFTSTVGCSFSFELRAQ